jgi:hypothetical protein
MPSTRIVLTSTQVVSPVFIQELGLSPSPIPKGITTLQERIISQYGIRSRGDDSIGDSALKIK